MPFKWQLQRECLLLLFESALRSIPFNVVLATLLTVDLYFKKVPHTKLWLWFSLILLLSVIRLIHCTIAIKKELYTSQAESSLNVFVSLTFLTGIIWGISYFIFLPYVSGINEAIIILVLGGMSAGAIASLSPFMPAYYVYVLSMFLPIIAYNYYTLEFDRIIFATMFLLFVIMVILTAKINSRLLHRVFSLNIQKDDLIQELSFFNKKLEESNDKIRQLSITDPLTRLYNRRYFDTIMTSEIKRAKRDKNLLSLVMMDIDNFKYINDTFGHPRGDVFLIYMAKILKDSMRRSNDMIARLGGDEFAVIMSNMPLEECRLVCNSLLSEFNKNNPYEKVTLSIGIICITPNNTDNLQDIVFMADRLLYQAKALGKNRIVSKIV